MTTAVDTTKSKKQVMLTGIDEDVTLNMKALAARKQLKIGEVYEQAARLLLEQENISVNNNTHLPQVA
jgi:hypothetical protein